MALRDRWPWLWLMPVAGLLCAAAGCSSPPRVHASGAGGTGRSGKACGSSRTGAGVPVVLNIIKGDASCATARRVQDEYAAMFRAGRVTGNGGGAPVRVSGWTCQGFPTPEVLQSGNASQCHTTTSEFVATLPTVPHPATTH